MTSPEETPLVPRPAATVMLVVTMFLVTLVVRREPVAVEVTRD